MKTVSAVLLACMLGLRTLVTRRFTLALYIVCLYEDLFVVRVVSYV